MFDVSLAPQTPGEDALTITSSKNHKSSHQMRFSLFNSIWSE